MSESGVLCPRCELSFYTPYGEEADDIAPPPALSRFDNETYICPWCGQDEAMRGVVPKDEWPIFRPGPFGQGRVTLGSRP